MSQPMSGRVMTGEPYTPERSAEFAVFRESFLSVHLSDENADALRIFGRLLYFKVLTGEGGERKEVGDQVYFLDLKGATLDLLQVRGVLQMLASAAGDYKVGMPTESFSAVAEKVQEALGELIEEMEAALAAESQLEDPELPAEYLKALSRKGFRGFVGDLREHARGVEDEEEKGILSGVTQRLQEALAQGNPETGKRGGGA